MIKMTKLYKGTPPSSFLERVKLILNDAYKASDQTKIEETNNDIEGKAFSMSRSFKTNKNSHYLLYRFDFAPGDKQYPFPYFNLTDTNGLGLGVAKVCDYALFVENEDQTYIILLELKKGKDDPRPQLQQMRFFIEFIQQRAKFSGIDIDAEIRMVGISNEIPKDYTKMGPRVYYENNFAQLYDGLYLVLSELAK